MNFEFERMAIPAVILVKPRIFGDTRGFLCETYRGEDFRAGGIREEFVQDNHSRSQRKVLRGLHFQTAGQAKLVRVARGRIFDVAVDLRRSSGSYGNWVGAELSDENMHQAYIPPGFAHGFCVLSEVADVCYRVGPVYYAPENEGAFRWDDPDVAVQWPISDPLLSERDAKAPTLAEIASQLPDW